MDHLIVTPASEVVDHSTIEDLGHIRRQETAANRRVAEAKARQRLEDYARSKGANAIINFRSHPVRNDTGHQVTVSGDAVRVKR